MRPSGTIPSTRKLNGKIFKISLPLCRNKNIIDERKNWLRGKGYTHFRTFKERGGIALYASK